jgi:hypothetical protein
MNEMAVTAEHLVVIGRGRLIADIGTAEFLRSRGRSVVRVRTTDPAGLAARLAAPGVEIAVERGDPTAPGSTTADKGPPTPAPTADEEERAAPGWTADEKGPAAPGWTTDREGPAVPRSTTGQGALTVSGLTTDEIGRAAAAAGITLLELTAQQASLEEAFIDLTRDAAEFRADTLGAQT